MLFVCVCLYFNSLKIGHQIIGHQFLLGNKIVFPWFESHYFSVVHCLAFVFQDRQIYCIYRYSVN